MRQAAEALSAIFETKFESINRAEIQAREEKEAAAHAALHAQREEEEARKQSAAAAAAERQRAGTFFPPTHVLQQRIQPAFSSSTLPSNPPTHPPTQPLKQLRARRDDGTNRRKPGQLLRRRR